MQLKRNITTATSKGCVSKAIYSENNINYMVKGNLIFNNGHDFGYEPYSEVMVSIIAKHLGIPCTEYKIVDSSLFKEVKAYNINHVSICEMDILLKDTQRMSINQYITLLRGKEPNANMFWNILLKLQIDSYYFCSMLVLDAIVGNEDRHLNNWDIIVSRQGVNMARIFDTGASLLALVPDRKLSLDFSIGRDISKPFKETHTRQLALLRRDYPQFRLSIYKSQIEYKLDNIMYELTPTINLLPEYRRQCVSKYIRNRFLHYANMFAMEG
jgi:hypothetical protein